VLVVSQKAISAYYYPKLSESLAKEGYEHSLYLTPYSKSSEASKSQKVYFELIRKIASCEGKHRSVLLIALGGGVIGDLTGFAASVYRRGVPYVQIPTTLTAQVDSAIGGKTGIDLPEGKNLLGAIYQPLMVLSDVFLLSSLPERHWCDGFAEVIKYGVIKDPSLFHWLDKKGRQAIQNNPQYLEKIVRNCARIKAKIVEKDEFDKKDVRIVLNFGHTAGHAIEAASKFSRQVTHGEAVSIGMLVACDIAETLGILNDKTLSVSLERILVKFGLPTFTQGIALEPILKAMGYDKKSAGGVNRFVLPAGLGKTSVVSDVPLSAIENALKKRKA
jgi:3-dehydroquinate synthase